MSSKPQSIQITASHQGQGSDQLLTSCLLTEENEIKAEVQAASTVHVESEQTPNIFSSEKDAKPSHRRQGLIQDEAISAAYACDSNIISINEKPRNI